MLVYYSHLKGLEVLAEKEGALLGSVRRVLVDSRRHKLEAITCKGRGVAAERWLPMAAVQRLGRDVVFVADAEQVREGQPAGRDVRDMLGLPVNTLDGKLLGQLADLAFETEGWGIKLLRVEGGGEADLDQRSVLGEDAVLVAEGTRLVVARQGDKRGGFLSKVFGKESDDKPSGEAGGQER